MNLPSVSTVSRNKTVWSDMLRALFNMAGSGTMVSESLHRRIFAILNFAIYLLLIHMYNLYDIIYCDIWPATDNETESVYVHALDSSDLTWLPHLWRVSDRVEFTNTDGDYTVLGLHGGTGYLTGNWGSVTEDRTFYFICEGFIE